MSKKDSKENDMGFIKLHRKMLNWEWYDDIPTKVVFIHLLLTANWKEGRYRGITVQPGQLFTSYEKIAKGTGLTIKQVRTAVAKLIQTNELQRADKGHTKFGLYTIVSWDSYQTEGRQMGTERAGKGQANGQDKGTNQRSKEIEEREEGKEYIYAPYQEGEIVYNEPPWEPEGGWDG